MPLHNFLLGFNCPQSFTYSCDLPDRLHNEFSAFLIRSALLAKAKNTLRKLTILACQRSSPVMGTLRPILVLEEVCIDWKLLSSDVYRRRIAKRPFAKVPPNSLRKLRLHEEYGSSRPQYDDLLNNAVQAQKRGTHVQPQPHDNLVDFEYGLELRELTILCGEYLVGNKAGFVGFCPPCHKNLSRWFHDCEEVGITLRHCVRGTDEWDQFMKLRREQM